MGSRKFLSRKPLLVVCINLARLLFNQLLHRTLIWVLLWPYVRDVINVCNQSTLSNKITFHNLGGPDSISCKVSRARLRLRWRRNSTCREEYSCSSGLPFLMAALWLGDLPGQTPQSYIIQFFVISQSILPTGTISVMEPWPIIHYETFYPKFFKVF